MKKHKDNNAVIAVSAAILGMLAGFVGPWWGAAVMGMAGLAVMNWLKQESSHSSGEEGKLRAKISVLECRIRVLEANEAQAYGLVAALEPKSRGADVLSETDGVLEIDWERQMVEIRKAWADGDYEFARKWLRKLAYTITSNDASEAARGNFKELATAFAREDPLYSNVMRAALPVIKEQPGIIQSKLAKQLPQFAAEDFRYVLYYAEIVGHVARLKKGNSYALSIPS